MPFIILGTSFFMAYSLMQNSKTQSEEDVELDILNSEEVELNSSVEEDENLDD